ncbi:MAG: PKD domain-containing protein, partial [Bacteroidota bacterium]
PNPSFSYTVNGSCQNVLFSTPAICSASGYSISGYQWNFGDIASGTSNTSFLAAPSHSFNSTGNYTVSLIRYFQCNTNDTITQVVSIVQPSLNILTANACAMGTATAQVINGTGPYTYSWSIGSQSNAVFSTTTSGIYTVNVIDQGAGYCSRTSTFNLVVPASSVSSISRQVLSVTVPATPA